MIIEIVLQYSFLILNIFVFCAKKQQQKISKEKPKTSKKLDQKTTKTKTSSNSSQTPKNEEKKETSKEAEKIQEKIEEKNEKSLCVEKTQADSVPKKLMILKLENGRSMKKTLDDVDGNLINAPYPIAGEKTADDFDDYLNNLGSSKK